MFKCSCYLDLRQTLINNATETNVNFLLLNDIDKLRHFFETHFICDTKYIVGAMKRRKSVHNN